MITPPPFCSVQKWKERRIVPSTDGVIVSNAYIDYVLFCIFAKITPLNSNTFGKKIGIKSKSVRVKKEVIRFYPNISIKKGTV